MKTHDEMVGEWMQDPAFAREYDGLEQEFALFDAYSAPSRTPIPRQAEQAFHGKPNTDSTGSRTAIPRQAEQFRGCAVESLAGQ